jgi:hypothetical protein
MNQTVRSRLRDTKQLLCECTETLVVFAKARFVNDVLNVLGATGFGGVDLPHRCPPSCSADLNVGKSLEDASFAAEAATPVSITRTISAIRLVVDIVVGANRETAAFHGDIQCRPDAAARQRLLATETKPFLQEDT